VVMLVLWGFPCPGGIRFCEGFVTRPPTAGTPRGYGITAPASHTATPASSGAAISATWHYWPFTSIRRVIAPPWRTGGYGRKVGQGRAGKGARVTSSRKK
jgi:hypothetical protein